METNIQVRLDKKTKNQARKVLEKMGLTLSGAIHIYLRQIIIQKRIPFSITTENGFTLDQEKKIIQESRRLVKDIKSGKAKAYKTVDDMFVDILEEGEVCTES